MKLGFFVTVKFRFAGVTLGTSSIGYQVWFDNGQPKFTKVENPPNWAAKIVDSRGVAVKVWEAKQVG